MSIRIYVHRKHQIKCRCVSGHTFAQAGCRDSDLRDHGLRGDVTRREGVLRRGRELLKRDLLGRSL